VDGRGRLHARATTTATNEELMRIRVVILWWLRRDEDIFLRRFVADGVVVISKTTGEGGR
jgi:hypothetical protein